MLDLGARSKPLSNERRAAGHGQGQATKKPTGLPTLGDQAGTSNATGRARVELLSRFGGSATRVLRQGPVERNRVMRARESKIETSGPAALCRIGLLTSAGRTLS